MTPKLPYSEYLRLKKSGLIIVAADKSTALRLVDYMPKRYQFAHQFWSGVWILSIPFFIVTAFFTYGLSLLGLITITPLIFGSVKETAAGFVIENAESSEEFYKLAVRAGGLTITRKR